MLDGVRSGCIAGDESEDDGGWTLVCLVSVASGAEDLLSRLIGMRLLGASRVTRWGSFLRRGGKFLVENQKTGYPTFLHSDSSMEVSFLKDALTLDRRRVRSSI